MKKNEDADASVFLTQTTDQIQSAMIIDILQQNGVLAYAVPNESGGVLAAYTGSSLYGDNIFVDEKDIEQAKEILETIPFAEKENGGESN